MIEMRSDTFTLPTKEMIEAITTAHLGDDVYGEDVTANHIEKLAAKILSKEAACLMPSGTMANLASIMAHCPRGSKVLVGNESDIYIYEAGGASVCGGIVYEPINTQPDGRLLIKDLENAIPSDLNDPQFALPKLICLENPHNRCGGTVLSLNYLKDVQNFARSHNLFVHMDGARIFNASVALGVKPSEIAQYADSIQFCLSKGLSAPIGSMVVGSKIFIDKVRWIRKMLGGGMRQVGIIAAPGIVALEQMIDRLKEDHENARMFAEGLSKMPEIKIDLDNVKTNIVFFEVIDDRFTWETFVDETKKRGLNIGELGYGRIRAVTHYGITKKDIKEALEIIRDVFKNCCSKRN